MLLSMYLNNRDNFCSCPMCTYSLQLTPSLYSYIYITNSDLFKRRLLVIPYKNRMPQSLARSVSCRSLLIWLRRLRLEMGWHRGLHRLELGADKHTLFSGRCYISAISPVQVPCAHCKRVNSANDIISCVTCRIENASFLQFYRMNWTEIVEQGVNIIK